MNSNEAIIQALDSVRRLYAKEIDDIDSKIRTAAGMGKFYVSIDLTDYRSDITPMKDALVNLYRYKSFTVKLPLPGSVINLEWPL